MTNLRVVRETDTQFQKAYKTDAGYDIIASDDMIIMAGTKELIPTGLRVAIPEGAVGILKSRSGLAVKKNLEVGAGVIDCGYTGEVKVLLRNLGNSTYIVKKGDKIAQMVILPIYTGFVNIVGSLEESTRGEDGFGSTGS